MSEPFRKPDYCVTAPCQPLEFCGCKLVAARDPARQSTTAGPQLRLVKSTAPLTRRQTVYRLIHESYLQHPNSRSRRKKWVRAKLFLLERGLNHVKVRMDGARPEMFARSLPGGL